MSAWCGPIWRASRSARWRALRVRSPRCRVGCALPVDGSVAPGKIGGYRPWLLEPHRELVHRLVAETPHLSIDRVGPCCRCGDRGEPGHHPAFFSGARGLSFNKTLFALEQARTAVARKRRAGRRSSATSDPDRLVFVERPGSRPIMAPLRGWAQRGQRLKGYAPHCHCAP